MQISATISPQPITPVAQSDAQTQGKSNETATTVKAADQAATTPKVFTPAPPLRPNVQDLVDIDRTLIALRQGA